MKLSSPLWLSGDRQASVRAMPPRREPQVALGRAVRKLREDQGLTQEEVSRRTKLHVTWVSRIEGGEVNPSWGTFKRLAEALEVRPSELAAAEEQLDPAGQRRRRRT